MIKVSDYICKNLRKLTGSKDVFLLSGGGMMHLLDSISYSNLNPVFMHHEQAASIASYANGRTKNTIGICFATSGPGATNVITGIAAAFTDSVPMIVISGQVSTKTSQNKLKIRQLGFQEFNIIECVKSCTKYAKYISNKNEIKYELEKAIFLAKSGRPGPVWLDVPIDIQASKINLKKLKSFNYKNKKLLLRTNPKPKKIFIYSILNKLAKAKRPLILLGHGVFLSGCKKEARKLIKKLNVPTQTTWNSIDLIPDNYKMYYGRANSYGPRFSNFIIQNADYVISIGARLGIQHTGYNVKEFCKDAFLDMVDLDRKESIKPDLKINRFTKCDAKYLVKELLNYQNYYRKLNKNHFEWFKYCDQIKKKYPISKKLEFLKKDKYVDPYYFFDQLSNLTNENELIALGSSGTCFTVSGQTFRAKKNQRVFHAKGMASMGFGIPSSIGVCYAYNKKRRVITVVGDGGFQLNIQELQTIYQNKLPIKIFAIQNQGYHAIRVTQDTYFNKNYIGSSKEHGVSIPSFRKVAYTYNFKYSKIENNKNLNKNLKKILKTDIPEIIEVIVDPKKHLYPKLASKLNNDGSMYTPPLQDLFPFIDRDEYYKNMINK